MKFYYPNFTNDMWRIFGLCYFGDMTQPGGNDYPVVQMGIDTITVRSHEDTAFALRGILGFTGNL